MTKKEEIIYATLDLASEYGLKSLSMSQIAEKVGIKKPSLYNHFESKEELIKEMYKLIREKSKESIPLKKIEGSKKEIINNLVLNYKKMVNNESLIKFYKVIYSERTTNKEAANIMVEETKKMIEATKILFKTLNIDNIDVVAPTFALTIHSIIDYELDCKMANEKYDKDLLKKYIEEFCDKYCKE